MKKEAKRDDFEPEMPDAGPAGYLASYLFEVGPVIGGDAGASPITNEELGWWQYNTGITLSSWESRTIMRLSREYFSEKNKATKRDCPAPWQPAGKNVIPLSVIDAKNAIRRLAEL